MPLVRTGFDLQYEEIRLGLPALGRAAVLPWDTEIFGFAVASYQADIQKALNESAKGDLAGHFPGWMACHGVSLCSCAIPAGNLFWKSFLPELGFRFVDFGIEARLHHLQSAPLPPLRAVLRNPEPGDLQAIQALAARSFSHGRYYADPLFPRELAEKRYRQWISNALSGRSAADRVYVLGDRGCVDGFFHVAVEDDRADLRLAAVSLELQNTGMGFELYVSVLHKLKAIGVRRMFTSISAANTPVTNLYAALGFRFGQPEIIYHWHASMPGRAGSTAK